MSRAKRDKSPPPPETMEEKVEDIHQRLVRDRNSELYGVLDILGNRRRLMWLNFNAGLARGVGFFIGVTLVGALLAGALALAFNAAVGYMGFSDLTLEKAVTAAVRKFSEVERLVDEAKVEVKEEEVQRNEMERLAPVEPDPLNPEAQPEGPR